MNKCLLIEVPVEGKPHTMLVVKGDNNLLPHPHKDFTYLDDGETSEYVSRCLTCSGNIQDDRRATQ